MATSKASKKTQIKTMGQAQDDKKKSGSKEKQDLMSIAEVRMVLYVVPIALILALFVYLTTR
ncbi:MAG: hypothetical protein JW704_00255 [Anaerolineaceae bacterium]|nr:hypothetical protein [Anaerolineaceae bacterium]MBN2677934.1 hypothetical protein [Anaerolineaceae bacterium]